MQKTQFVLLGLDSSDLWSITKQLELLSRFHSCTVSPQHFQYLTIHTIQFDLVLTSFHFCLLVFVFRGSDSKPRGRFKRSRRTLVSMFVSTDRTSSVSKSTRLKSIKNPKFSWILDIFTSMRKIHFESTGHPQLNDLAIKALKTMSYDNPLWKADVVAYYIHHWITQPAYAMSSQTVWCPTWPYLCVIWTSSQPVENGWKWNASKTRLGKEILFCSTGW